MWNKRTLGAVVGAVVALNLAVGAWVLWDTGSEEPAYAADEPRRQGSRAPDDFEPAEALRSDSPSGAEAPGEDEGPQEAARRTETRTLPDGREVPVRQAIPLGPTEVDPRMNPAESELLNRLRESTNGLALAPGLDQERLQAFPVQGRLPVGVVRGGAVPEGTSRVNVSLTEEQPSPVVFQLLDSEGEVVDSCSATTRCSLESPTFGRHTLVIAPPGARSVRRPIQVPSGAQLPVRLTPGDLNNTRPEIR